MSDLERIRPEAVLGGRARSVDSVLEAMRAAWEGIVGVDAARNSRPVRVGSGGLVVACRSAVWAGELRMAQARVEAAASTLAGRPTAVRFEVGDVPSDPTL